MIVPTRLSRSAWMLIFANLIPIFGVMFLGWSVRSVLVLYWLENVIVGVFNIPKILISDGTTADRISTAIFFLVHFGGFTAIHGAFVFTLFKEPAGSSGAGMAAFYGFSLLSLFLSHLYSFKTNFIGKGEYLDRDPQTQMFIPYGRVVVMHLVVLFGGIMLTKFGSPMPALLLLIVLKTGIDLIAHKLEHSA